MVKKSSLPTDIYLCFLILKDSISYKTIKLLNASTYEPKFMKIVPRAHHHNEFKR